jgi:hypothetical protein
MRHLRLLLYSGRSDVAENETTMTPSDQLSVSATLTRRGVAGDLRAELEVGVPLNRGRLRQFLINMEEGPYLGCCAAIQLGRQGDALNAGCAAWLYETGTEVEQSDDAALDWYEWAAQLGNHEAAYIYGEFLLSEATDAAERFEALRWLGIAATAGDNEAMAFYGDLLILDHDEDAEGLAWVTRAARLGCSLAHLYLTHYYRDAIAVPAHPVRALVHALLGGSSTETERAELVRALPARDVRRAKVRAHHWRNRLV